MACTGEGSFLGQNPYTQQLLRLDCVLMQSRHSLLCTRVQSSSLCCTRTPLRLHVHRELQAGKLEEQQEEEEEEGDLLLISEKTNVKRVLKGKKMW
jgi:hypothetical protein